MKINIFDVCLNLEKILHIITPEFMFRHFLNINIIDKKYEELVYKSKSLQLNNMFIINDLKYNLSSEWDCIT